MTNVIRHPFSREVHASNLILTFAVGACAIASLLFGFFSHARAATTLGPNLISNPSFESGISGAPDGWLMGGYGANTRTLTYPATPAHTGSRAASVKITSYTDGDAKWYVAPVAVPGGSSYQFSDWYTSTVPSEIDIEVQHSNGSYSYIVLGRPDSASSYTKFSANFTVPNDASSITVYHLIDSVGTLTVDDYSLNAVQTSSDNLVTNGDFSQTDTGGMPTGWLMGGWGNNTRNLSFPVTGVSGNGAKTTITSFTSGDAKWYFDPVVVSPGIYTYSDEYKSDVTSDLTVQYIHTDGSITYADIASLPASGSFTNATVQFVVTSGIAKVTVFHLIQSVGSLTIDNVSLVQYSSTGAGIFSTGAVTLTFDNGWLSQYDNVRPKLLADNLTGTFYIITHELSDFGYSGFMSKAQVKQLYADGNEIGSHTQTHADLLTESYSQQQQEIAGSRQDLLSMNVGPVDSFAYPFGNFDATSTALVKSAGYTSARATLNGYATPAADIYHLPRFVVLNTTTAAQMKSWIDEAVNGHVWLIIEFHQVDNSNDTYATTPAIFNQVADYLKQKGVPVVTVSQGIQALAH